MKYSEEYIREQIQYFTNKYLQSRAENINTGEDTGYEFYLGALQYWEEQLSEIK